MRSAILVCEREPYWTPELQRQFQASGVAVRGCRKWSDFADMSRAYSRVVQIVALDETTAGGLTDFGRRLQTPESSPLILVAAPRFVELEWVFREAGVQAFFSEHPTGEDLARCCRRWL